MRRVFGIGRGRDVGDRGSDTKKEMKRWRE